MSTSFDPNIPADTDTVYDAYFSFRKNMLSLNNIFQKDHVSGTEQGLQGRHKQITFVSPSNINSQSGVLTATGARQLLFDGARVSLDTDWKFTKPPSVDGNILIKGVDYSGGVIYPNNFGMKWIVGSMKKKSSVDVNIQVKDIEIEPIFALCTLTSLESPTEAFTFNFVNFFEKLDSLNYEYRFDFRRNICTITNSMQRSVGFQIIIIGTKK